MCGMGFWHGRRVVDITLNDLRAWWQDLFLRRRGERCDAIHDGGALSDVFSSENGTNGRLSRLSKLPQAAHAQSCRRRHGWILCVVDVELRSQNRGVSGKRPSSDDR